jgi:ketosteroid isomerase-like protein
MWKRFVRSTRAGTAVTLRRKWTEDWAKAFSEVRITNPDYIDAGDVVIAQSTGEGTNDGPFGSLKPTGRRLLLQFCEVWHFDKDGQMVSGNGYYDQHTRTSNFLKSS